MIFDPSTSVSDLLHRKLPTQSAALVLMNTTDCFCNDVLTSTTAIERLNHGTLPPAVFIKKLDQIFGQAWFDRPRSVVDHQYKHSRLPLYIIKY